MPGLIASMLNTGATQEDETNLLLAMERVEEFLTPQLKIVWQITPPKLKERRRETQFIPRIEVEAKIAGNGRAYCFEYQYTNYPVQVTSPIQGRIERMADEIHAGILEQFHDFFQKRENHNGNGDGDCLKPLTRAAAASA